MPDFVGFTIAQVDAYLTGNPTTTDGVDRHYQIVPPRGTIPPWNPTDTVASQSPEPGFCSATALVSTLYLTTS
jgi:hypothetical protein